MASEWYVEDNDRATGPFTVAQMKAQATSSRIKPETRVRKGRRGKWIAAKNVKGLLATKVGPQTTSSDTTSSSKRNSESSPQVTGVIAGEEGVFLAPIRNRKRRAIIFGVLAAFILIGQAPIPKQLFFDITVGLIIGSYPIVEVKKKSIEQTIMVFFFPVYKKVWKLRDFVGVETGVEPRIADTIGCLVFIFWFWFLFRLFDHLMPWLGGNYKLFLRQYDDEKLLIWQGNNTTDFEANLALFEAVGLPIG
jgi:hypothetical protein